MGRILFSLIFYALFMLQINAGQQQVFNVKQYGAVDDGITDISQAVLSAWKDACAWNGTGEVLVPEGTFYLEPVLLRGTCKGDMVFQIQGVLKAPTELDKFTTNSWIFFHDVAGLTVTGGGSVDGRGASAWPSNHCKTEKHCKTLPVSMKFKSINNARVQSITFVDSKYFHIIIEESQNMVLQSVNITAPGHSPNTDGIHIAQSTGINISGSVIATGDDCISIGPGNSDITISNIVCGPGHGISIGSLGKEAGEGDVRDVTVRDCTLTGTTNGARIKTWDTPYQSQATNITYHNIVMNNVQNPIIIDQSYCDSDSCNKGSSSHVAISHVSFNNIRGDSQSKVAVELLCSKDVPCRDVELNDIHLLHEGKDSMASCSNAYGTAASQNMVPSSCLKS